MESLETYQRRFYEVDEEALDRIVKELFKGELSVVEGGLLGRFEEKAAELFGARHAVSTCNGTASLHLALFAIDLKPGDEVIIPTFSYYAFAIPVCMMGARPVFCDITPDTLTIDLADAEAMITPRTKAVIVHQPWGLPADAEALRTFADRHGITLIGDASHAQGALWNGKPLGHYYDFICASLGKGKLISGGELGVVTANDDRRRDRMLLYGHVNRVPKGLITDEYRHMQNAVGVKYRPHPFAMALALQQMETYPQRSARLVNNIQRFEAGLREIDGFEPFHEPDAATRVYWRVPIWVYVDDPPAVLKALGERGVPVDMVRASRGRRLVHEHNVVTAHYGVKTERGFPVADGLDDRILLVQAFPFYDEAMVGSTHDIFREVSRGLA
jgi:dTDP-4-amino-4,6-dideoxygalactose transaminase